MEGYLKTIIGIVGVKTSGKSTVSQMIKEFVKDDCGIKEVALADKLKNVCASVFDIPRDTFDDQRYKEIPFSIFNLECRLSLNNIHEVCCHFGKQSEFHEHDFTDIASMELKSARHIAQIVGTQVLRTLGDEDIHCKHVNLNNRLTIISDIRFPNEYKYFADLKDYRFIPLYVSRKEAEDQVDMETSHASETSVFLFRDKCRKLNNNGSLSDLEREVQKAINEEYYGN